jgi:hypothetical protein
MPNQREIFTKNPLYPDYTDYDDSALIRVFQTSLDAVRFEITAAVYAAFEDEDVSTPESWDELSFASDLYSDSRTLTCGFARWHNSSRGQGIDIDNGDVTGPAMEMVQQWNSERGECVSKAFANLVLYFEERGQTKSPVDIDTPINFDKLYRVTTDVVRTREESVLGVPLSWDTVERALEPFKDQADLQQVGFLKEISNNDVEILAQRFREAFRTQFTLRNRLYRDGQIELSHHLNDPVEVGTNWMIPKERVKYTNNGVPGLLQRDMFSDLQSEVVNSWVDGLNKRDKLEILTVSTPEAIYSRLHQQLKGAKEQPPLLILNSDHLSFNNAELGLNGISWPTESNTPVIEHSQTSKQIPVYKYDTEYDAVILPPETSIRVTEPDSLAQIPMMELKRLDVITLRKIEDAHPYESLPTETISKKWDSILVKANYRAQIHCDGPAPIAIRLTK